MALGYEAATFDATYSPSEVYLEQRTKSASEARSSLSPRTVELHLSGLIVTANHPDMQKIPIIGFFFENRLH
jgi:hypothetical protein